jgi:hypothetical protein
MQQLPVWAVSKLLGAAVLALSWSLVAHAQSQSGSGAGIYICTDATGRKITSDRPIPECVDREQRVLNPSGTLRTTIGPTLTGPERVALEAKKRREAEEQARVAEEKRRERALLVRYPNKATHDKERAEALAQIAVVRQAALNRIVELRKQRKDMDGELEFYAKDPNRAPLSLQRQLVENTKSIEIQERFITDQDAETNRVNARFDEELVRLKQLWAQVGTPTN